MVPTCWASDDFSKPVMVSAKAKSENDQHCNACYFEYGTVKRLLQLLMNFFFLLLPIYILLNFFVLSFSVLIADLLTKKESVLLVFVTAKAPSLLMIFGRCCLLALFLAKKLLACLVLVQLLLLLSGDVETNPGPTTGELRRCT